MPTINQLVASGRKCQNPYRSKSPARQECPQRRRLYIVYTTTPKKPNSAIRKVAKVMLNNWYRSDFLYPWGRPQLQEHSVVLVRGGRVKDFTRCSLSYRSWCTLIPQVFAKRRQSRSLYGAKRPKEGLLLLNQQKGKK